MPGLEFAHLYGTAGTPSTVLHLTFGPTMFQHGSPCQRLGDMDRRFRKNSARTAEYSARTALQAVFPVVSGSVPSPGLDRATALERRAAHLVEEFQAEHEAGPAPEQDCPVSAVDCSDQV